jgi:Rv0078B-related antitoxin
VLVDEQSSPEQIEIYRRMSGEERLRVAERLYWSAWKMKIAGLRAQHPDWSEEELKRETRRIFLYART